MTKENTTAMERDAQRIRQAIDEAVDDIEANLEELDDVHASVKRFNGETVIATVEGRKR